MSDTYVALFSHFIACGVWEAVYILDGLLKNQSTLQPDTLYADTHGQAEPVFGLAALLGIQLLPRMRTWNDVTFYRVDRHTTYKHIDTLFTQVVDWDVIEWYWQDMMPVVLSIQAGQVLPSMLLQKLGVYSGKNSLYKAFSELGRVERTLFLLDYMSNAVMRQQIRAETTKVESSHHFTDWIAFGGPVLRSGDPVEQEKRIKYRDLVANAMILHNVVDMTNVLRALLPLPAGPRGGRDAQTLMQPTEVIRTADQPHPGRQDGLSAGESVPSAHQWRQGRVEGGIQPLDARGIDSGAALGGSQDSRDLVAAKVWPQRVQ